MTKIFKFQSIVRIHNTYLKNLREPFSPSVCYNPLWGTPDTLRRVFLPQSSIYVFCPRYVSIQTHASWKQTLGPTSDFLSRVAFHRSLGGSWAHKAGIALSKMVL